MMYNIAFYTAFIGVFVLILLFGEQIVNALWRTSSRFREWFIHFACVKTIEFRVPSDTSEDFQNKVLSYWFEADEPNLIHHRQKFDDGFRYFTFDSDCCDDISVVLSMLPIGSGVITPRVQY